MKSVSLKEKYNKEVLPELKQKLGLKNSLAAPKVSKVVINVGLGRMSQQTGYNDKILPEVLNELSQIVGQRPRTNPSKKSIAGFKMRQGQIIGAKTTLRGERMYAFIDKLNKLVMPRVRDFKGIDPKNIDAHGNLSIGFKDHLVFPEITPEHSKADFGMQITFVTTAKNKEEAVELLKLIGVPLKA